METIESLGKTIVDSFQNNWTLQLYSTAKCEA